MSEGRSGRRQRGLPSERPAPSDDLADLLVRAGRGDSEAFEAAYDQLSGAVYGLALRIVRDPQIAEDVAQEALVEAWRQAAQFRPTAGSPHAWVLTIAHRRAVDRVRTEQAHARRLREHGPRLATAPEDPDVVVDAMHGEWRAARVRQGLSRLTPLQREAIELTYYGGYTNAELAQSLGIPLGTAKARIRDALIRLRDAWEVTE